MTDVVVLGADPNALVAAAALAEAGRRVVLVADGALGGVHALLGDTRHVPDDVVAALGLARGDDAPVFLADGSRLDDADGVAGWRSSWARWAPAIRALASRPPPAPIPSIVPGAPGPRQWLELALGARRAAEIDLPALVGVALGSAEEWLARHVPEGPARGALAWDAVVGAWDGPREAGSAGILLARAATAADPVIGGVPGLVRAAVDRAKRRGVEIVGGPVRGIRVEGGRVAGARVGDGGFDAPIVASALDLQRTVALVGSRDVPPALAALARGWRCRGAVAIARATIRSAGPARRIRHVRSVDQLEVAVRATRRGELADDPPFELRLDGDIATAVIVGAPYAAGGAGRRLAEVVGRALADVADDVGPVEILAPPDLEARFGLTGGHVLQGELALDQLWIGRPGVGLGARAALPGLFLASDAIHPGGLAIGGAGLSAARAIGQIVGRRTS